MFTAAVSLADSYLPCLAECSMARCAVTSACSTCPRRQNRSGHTSSVTYAVPCSYWSVIRNHQKLCFQTVCLVTTGRQAMGSGRGSVDCDLELDMTSIYCNKFAILFLSFYNLVDYSSTKYTELLVVCRMIQSFFLIRRVLYHNIIVMYIVCFSTVPQHFMLWTSTIFIN